jgi:hypothetical protein
MEPESLLLCPQDSASSACPKQGDNVSICIVYSLAFCAILDVTILWRKFAPLLTVPYF